jgi:hypothetical protein
LREICKTIPTRELGRIEGAGHRGLSGWEPPAQTEHHPAHVARLPGGRATLRVSRSGRGSPPLKWISGGRVQVAPAGSRETPLPPLTSLPGSPGEACAKPPAGSQCDSVTGGRSRPRANRRNRRGHIPCAPGATAQGRRRERLLYALCGHRPTRGGRGQYRRKRTSTCGGGRGYHPPAGDRVVWVPRGRPRPILLKRSLADSGVVNLAKKWPNCLRIREIQRGTSRKTVPDFAYGLVSISGSRFRSFSAESAKSGHRWNVRCPATGNGRDRSLGCHIRHSGGVADSLWAALRACPNRLRPPARGRSPGAAARPGRG